MNLQQRLLHMRIKNAVTLHDYLHVAFENGGVMNIYNSFSVPCKPENLIGHTIEGVVIEPDERALSILFSNATTLRVDLSDGAYRGPEALEIDFPGEPIMVWN